MIPRTIWAAWCGGAPLPKHDCYLDSWREKLPGYEINLLGDSDIPRSRCTDGMAKRDKIVNAAQYSCWNRLYREGGVYLDLDVDILRSLDPLLDHDAFLGIENDGPGSNWAACGVVGAMPFHPFIREVLAYMDSFDYDHPKVENELGPRMFTKLLGQHGWDRKDRDATVAFVRLLNSKRFYPYSWQEDYDPKCVTAETYAVHRWAHTWNPCRKEPVSIIIPCYNMAGFLPDAIDSALAQTVAPREVIVVDDGSTEGSPAKAVNRYGSKVKLITKVNGGVASARNAGIAASSGEWVICLDADDKLDPRYIERLIGRNDIVSPTLVTFGAGKPINWNGAVKHPLVADYVRENQSICGSLFRRKWWEKVGGYDEAMRTGFEDWDFWTRVVHAGAHVTTTKEVLFQYRVYVHDRSEVPGTMAMADTKRAEILAYMREKWARLGIKVQPQTTAPARPVRPITYPVRLAVACHLEDRVYPKGATVGREVAVALKAAGQLQDPRIV